MRAARKKEKTVRKNEDATLFGLLSSYKSCNTYFRILVNEKKESIVVQITDNPGNWPPLKEGKYSDFNILKRSDLGCNKLFVNYLSPVHLIEQVGPTLGIKLPEDRFVVMNFLDNEGYFTLETDIKYKDDIIQSINKLINLSPQKKYEILEKSLSKEI